MSESSKLIVPDFITASNPKRLREEMLKKNLEFGQQTLFQHIQQQQDGNWIAWFDSEYKIDFRNIKGKVNDAKS